MLKEGIKGTKEGVVDVEKNNRQVYIPRRLSSSLPYFLLFSFIVSFLSFCLTRSPIKTLYVTTKKVAFNFFSASLYWFC